MPRRLVPAQIFRDAQTYLHWRVESSGVTKKFEASKKNVREYLKKHGEPDDEGNICYYFPRVITAANDLLYAGVMLKRAPGSSYMVDSEVKALLKERDLDQKDYERVVYEVEHVDADMLYVLQQEGKISESDLRGLQHEAEPSYSLWPIEAEEELEGEDA